NGQPVAIKTTQARPDSYECDPLYSDLWPPGLCTGYIATLDGEHTEKFNLSDCHHYYVHTIHIQVEVRTGAVQVAYKELWNTDSANGIAKPGATFSYNGAADLGSIFLTSIDSPAQEVNYNIYYTCRT